MASNPTVARLGLSTRTFGREHLARPLATVGRFAVFALRTILALPSVFTRRPRWREMLVQLDGIGVGAIPITHITGGIAGMLVGLQTRTSLEQFGITSLFPQMLTIALVREVGPTFVALVAGARAASGIASELATMSVTQQVDAMRALRQDPVKALAAPRAMACLLGFPMLALVGVLSGFFGGMLVGVYTMEQSPRFFFNQAFSVLDAREIVPNLICKPLAFGLMIGLIPTFLGLTAEGGTRAVGGAAVRSVVFVTVGVLLLTYSVGEFFRQLWPPTPW